MMGDDSVIQASKRIVLLFAPWDEEESEDWFESWNPRTDSPKAEGTWHHWANLAAMILSHPRTQAVAPDLYRPDLQPDHNMYTGGNKLPKDMLRVEE